MKRDKEMERLKNELSEKTSALNILRSDHNRQVAENAKLRDRLKGIARIADI